MTQCTTKPATKCVIGTRLTPALIAHGGHPMLSWTVDNIHVRVDPAENIKPDKQKSTEKINGVVALVMALDRAIRCGADDSTSSVYDERGLLIF